MATVLKPIAPWYQRYVAVGDLFNQAKKHALLLLLGVSGAAAATYYQSRAQPIEAIDSAPLATRSEAAPEQKPYAIVNEGNNLWCIVRDYARSNPGAVDTSAHGMRSAVNAVANVSAQIPGQQHMLEDIVTAKGPGQDGIVGDRIMPGDSIDLSALVTQESVVGDVPEYVVALPKEPTSMQHPSLPFVMGALALIAVGVANATYARQFAPTVPTMNSPESVTKSRDEFCAESAQAQQASRHYAKAQRTEYIANRKATAQSMRNAGVTLSDIASVLGVSYSQARRDIH